MRRSTTRGSKPERNWAVGVDALASLDRDDVGADRLDPQRGGDPGDDVLGWQMAVQQQHLN